jgi:hypothetical protein
MSRKVGLLDKLSEKTEEDVQKIWFIGQVDRVDRGSCRNSTSW